MRQLLLLTLIFLGSALGQTPTQSPITSVALVVSGGTDNKATGLVQSYIGRELRALRDVSIVSSEDKPEFQIEIVPITLETKEGAQTGCAYSYVVKRHDTFADFYLETVIKPKVSDGEMAILKYHAETYYAVEKHGIRTTGMGDLSLDCQNFIATMDSQIFEPLREIARTARSITEGKSSRPKPPTVK